MSFIPYGRQTISDDDVQSVVDVLRSDFLTQGPIVPLFEEAIQNYCKVEHAVAFNSATSALHLACLALDVRNGDVVWTSPITFVASANCALYCGATVDFIDIDPKTYNISIDALTHKLEQAEKDGTLPKVVIPVHLSGQPSEMQEIRALSQKYGFKVIEDASHAIGAKYKNNPVGNCKFSDITIFSFHPVKIITTGEGGVATTQSSSLAREMQLLRSHGITRNQEEMVKQADGPWYYEQVGLGFNYRMTDMQAALGLSQFKMLDIFIVKRRSIVNVYNNTLNELPITLPWQHPDAQSAWHLYVVRLQLDKTDTHINIFNKFREAEIGVNLHYIPVYRQPYYEKMGYERTDWPQAERYYSEAISLPIFSALDKDSQLKVTNTLKSIL